MQNAEEHQFLADTCANQLGS